MLQQLRDLGLTDPEVLHKVSLLQWDVGDRQIAVQTMAKLAASQPGSLPLRCDMGKMLRILGRYDEAKSVLEGVLHQSPTDPDAMTGMALTLTESGRAAEGLAWAHRAAEANPTSPAPQCVLGRIFARQNRVAEARACYEAALRFSETTPPRTTRWLGWQRAGAGPAGG